MNLVCRKPLRLLTIVLSLQFFCSPSFAERTEEKQQQRRFAFNYAVTLLDLEDADVAKVWLPLATSDANQQVRLVRQRPAQQLRSTREPKYGNEMLYGEFPGSKPCEISLEYEIHRNEVRSFDRALETKDASTQQHTDSKQAAIPPDLSVYLKSNRQVPISGKPIALLPSFGLQQTTTAKARRIYDQVDALVKYDKTKPGYGNGDVLWVCDSRTGNCTDFHSLFISMARSQAIPAKFEIGFPIPSEPSGSIGGYHCWASYLDGDRWIPVDISEADKHPEMKEYFFGNLTADRVTFSTGRDLVLEPEQQGAPLNYFVYPYVEVNGKPLEKSRIKLEFTYRDLADAKNSKE